MTQHLMDHPALFVLGVLVWIPVTIWILSMLHWFISGEIEGLTAFVGTIVALVLGATAISPPVPWISGFVFAATFGMVLLFAPLKAYFDRRALHVLDIKAVEKVYEQLAFKPDNVGARLRLAKLLFAKGLQEHAIAIGEDALKGLPEQVFHEEYRMVGGWRREMGRVVARSLPCLNCGTPNEPGRLHCKRCGSAFLLDHARGKWLGPNIARRIVAGWASGAAILVGVPLAASVLEPIPSLIAMSVLVLASIGFAWLALKPTRDLSVAK